MTPWVHAYESSPDLLHARTHTLCDVRQAKSDWKSTEEETEEKTLFIETKTTAGNERRETTRDLLEKEGISQAKRLSCFGSQQHNERSEIVCVCVWLMEKLWLVCCMRRLLSHSNHLLHGASLLVCKCSSAVSRPTCPVPTVSCALVREWAPCTRPPGRSRSLVTLLFRADRRGRGTRGRRERERERLEAGVPSKASRRTRFVR